MKFSKYISKVVTQVMALFQKQHSCFSNKATTICGQAAESLRQVPIRHDREGKFAEIKVRFVPPTMCRLTPIKDNHIKWHFIPNAIKLTNILIVINDSRPIYIFRQLYHKFWSIHQDFSILIFYQVFP